MSNSDFVAILLIFRKVNLVLQLVQILLVPALVELAALMGRVVEVEVGGMVADIALVAGTVEVVVADSCVVPIQGS